MNESRLFLRKNFHTIYPPIHNPNLYYPHPHLISILEEEPSSIPFILSNPPRQNHHPQQKHRANDLHRKRRSPILTQTVILQPDQSGFAGAYTGNVAVAVGVNAASGPVQHDGKLDQAGEPEDEADEGTDDDNGGREVLLLGDEPDDYKKPHEG